MRRLIDICDHLLNWIVGLAAVLMILVSAYSIWDNAQIYRGASNRQLLVYKPQLESEIPFQVISGDQVFWLTIYDTNIDYPVMQGQDDYEYLNKNPLGEFSLSGSIFLDSRNDPALTDDYSVIYGHHMEYGAMFGSLDEYTRHPYFATHRRGHIVTPDKVYDLNIFAVSYADAKDSTIYGAGSLTSAEIVDRVRESAVIFTEPTPGNRIAAFSTCASYDTSDRLMVFAELRENKR